jgi:hypothetical protein
MAPPTWTMVKSLEIVKDFRFNDTAHLDNRTMPGNYKIH